MRVFSTAIALFIFIYAFSATCVVAGSEVKIEIIATLNVRGALLPIDSKGRECDAITLAKEEGSLCFGGMARKKQYISQRRSLPNVNTYVVDGGNFAFGSLWFKATGGKANAELAQYLRYDVMGLSTNEFFGGVTSLDGYIKRFYASTTFVITNVDVEGEDSLHDVTSNKLLVRYRVVVKNGVKVGFLNVVPSNLPETAGKANLGNTTMIQFREAVETAISEARKEFSQIVTFVVTAGGYDVWQIEALLFGVEAVSVAIVPAFVTNSQGSMTRSITKQNGDKAIIVTGENPLGVAHLKLSYDTTSSSSTLKSWNASSLVHLTNTTLSDAEVSSKLDFYNKEVVKYKTVKVGNSSEWLVYDDKQILLRNNVTKLGVFYVNALMKSCEGCDVAMVNAGGIRAGIFAGPINFGDVVKVAPFGNFQTTCKMKGSLLLDIVIDSAYRTNIDKTRRFGGHLLFSGLYYSYNPSPTIDKSKKIIEVAILNRKSGKLQLIDPRAFYKVGVQSYLFKGGDGYNQFQDGISNGDIADINEMGVPEDTALYNAITAYPGHLIPNQPDWDSLCKQQMNQPLMAVAAPPSQVCPAIISTASVDFLKVCPTSRDINNCRMQRSRLLSELKVLIGPNASFIGEKEGGASNNDPCTSCSGLGVCNRKVCTCYTVSNGPWLNTPLISGDDCSEVVEPVNTPALLPIVVGALCLCFALFAIGYFQYHWKNKVFKRSSPVFCQIINVGCVLSCFGSFVIALPYTDATCYTYAVLSDLSFILQFGALFIKNYRINKIFNNRTMKVVKVTDLDLLQMLGVLLIGAMVVLAFALALDPFQRAPFSAYGYAANACGTKSGSAMGVQLIVILNMLFLSWGCYLSYKTRNVHADFNESFYIFLAIYNYAFFSFFMFPTAYIFSFTSVGGFRNIVGVAMTVPSTLVAVLLFFSKRKNMFVDDEPKAGSGFVMKGAANNKNNKNSGASEDDDFTAKQQIIDLKMELSDKDDALKKVITQIMKLGGSVDDAYNVSLRRGNPGPTVSIELAAVTNPLNRLDSGFITTTTTSNDARTGSSIFTPYSTASSDVRTGSGVIDRTGSSTMSLRSLPTTKPPTPTKDKKKIGEVKMLDTLPDGGGGGQTDDNNNTTNTIS